MKRFSRGAGGMETGRPLTPREAAGKVALLKVAGTGEVVALMEGLEPELAMLPLEPKWAAGWPSGEAVGLCAEGEEEEAAAAAARSSAAR